MKFVSNARMSIGWNAWCSKTERSSKQNLPGLY